jgi:hypothetical protein
MNELEKLGEMAESLIALNQRTERIERDQQETNKKLTEIITSNKVMDYIVRTLEERLGNIETEVVTIKALPYKIMWVVIIAALTVIATDIVNIFLR